MARTGPSYRVGQRVLCRAAKLGSWRAIIRSIALASELPTLSYDQGWAYEVHLPTGRDGSRIGTIWLEEAVLCSHDEEAS